MILTNIDCYIYLGFKFLSFDFNNIILPSKSRLQLLLSTKKCPRTNKQHHILLALSLIYVARIYVFIGNLAYMLVTKQSNTDTFL